MCVHFTEFFYNNNNNNNVFPSSSKVHQVFVFSIAVLSSFVTRYLADCTFISQNSSRWWATFLLRVPVITVSCHTRQSAHDKCILMSGELCTHVEFGTHFAFHGDDTSPVFIRIVIDAERYIKDKKIKNKIKNKKTHTKTYRKSRCKIRIRVFCPPSGHTPTTSAFATPHPPALSPLCLLGFRSFNLPPQSFEPKFVSSRTFILTFIYYLLIGILVPSR